MFPATAGIGDILRVDIKKLRNANGMIAQTPDFEIDSLEAAPVYEDDIFLTRFPEDLYISFAANSTDTDGDYAFEVDYFVFDNERPPDDDLYARENVRKYKVDDTTELGDDFRPFVPEVVETSAYLGNKLI